MNLEKVSSPSSPSFLLPLDHSGFISKFQIFFAELKLLDLKKAEFEYIIYFLHPDLSSTTVLWINNKCKITKSYSFLFISNSSCMSKIDRIYNSSYSRLKVEIKRITLYMFRMKPINRGPCPS